MRKEAVGSHSAVLATSYPGEEARVRHAKLLVRLDRRAEARAALDALLDRAKAAPRFYRDKERAWLDEARALRASLGPA